MIQGGITTQADFGRCFNAFFPAWNIGTVPLAIRPNGSLQYGFSDEGVDLPRPLLQCSRDQVEGYLSRAADAGVGGVSNSYRDRFMSSWDTVHSELERIDNVYGLGNGRRSEALHPVAEGLGSKFHYAGKALIAEDDAAHYRQGGDMSSWKQKINVAATAWLNFMRIAEISDSFGRHIVSHATFYAWHSESWRVAELLFDHSAKLFADVENFEEAAHDHLRAAMAHSRMSRYFISIVARRIGSALEAFGATLPPPAEVVADAEILHGAAIALGQETPGGYVDRGL